MARKRTIRSLFFSLLFFLALCAPSSASTVCRITYSLNGWSAIYKYARGTGAITCEDGQAANVRIVAHGGGFTGGTLRIENGTGRFSHTAKVEDLFRTYIEITTHAGIGAGKNVEARAMFAGTKRLSLAGTGDGIGIGMAVGGFAIRAQ